MRILIREKTHCSPAIRVSACVGIFHYEKKYFSERQAPKYTEISSTQFTRLCYLQIEKKSCAHFRRLFKQSDIIEEWKTTHRNQHKPQSSRHQQHGNVFRHGTKVKCCKLFQIMLIRQMLYNRGKSPSKYFLFYSIFSMLQLLGPPPFVSHPRMNSTFNFL